MKIYTIAEVKMEAVKVKDLKDNKGKAIEVAIPNVQGKLTKLYPVTTRSGAHGEFNIQNGEIADSTGAIKLVLKYRDPLPFKVGDELIIQANMTNKGLLGLTTSYENYTSSTNGQQVSRAILSVSSKGMINLYGPQTNATVPTNDDNGSGNTEVAKTQTEALKEVLKDTVNPKSATKFTLEDRLDRYGPLYDLCYQRAVKCIKKTNFTEEEIRFLADRFFDLAAKEGLLDQVVVNDMAKDDIPF